MANIFTSSWENGAGLTDSIWDSEQGTAGALSVATDFALHGTNSLKFSRNGSTTNYLEKSILAAGTVGILIPIRINAAGSESFSVFKLIGSSDILTLGIYGGGTNQLYILNLNNFAEVGTNFSFSVDTTYQLAVKFVNGTSIVWKIWDATGTTLVHTEQSTTTSVAAVNCTTILVGSDYLFNSGNNIYWVDYFVADNAAYPSPYVLSSVVPVFMNQYRKRRN